MKRSIYKRYSDVITYIINYAYSNQAENVVFKYLVVNYVEKITTLLNVEGIKDECYTMLIIF